LRSDKRQVPSGREENRQRRPRSREEIRRRKELQRKRRRQKRIRLFFKLSLCVLACVLLAALGKYGWDLLQGTKHADAEKLAEEGYPESLLRLLEKNPETEEFVLHYMQHKDKHEEIELDVDWEKGEIPLFLQWDERWGYETYGDDFLALTGCGPTCLAMVRCGLSGDNQWNPYEVAKLAEENGYYVSGSGSSWELMTSGAALLGLKGEEVVFDETHIRSLLSEGTPIICVVGPGDFTDNGHFLVMTGLDPEGHVIIKDPNSKIRSRETWELSDLMGQMKNLWSFAYE